MAQLWFEDRFSNRRIVANCETESDIIKNIHSFINQCNKNKPVDKQFKIYYMRTWEENDEVVFDVGSHTEFFYVSCDSYNKLKGIKNE